MDNNTSTPPTPPPQSPATQQSTTTVETVQWFDSISEAPQAPKKKSLKPIILIAALGILLVSAAAAWIVSNSGARCLTTADLQDLVDNSEVDPVTSPSTFFLSYQVEFQPDSASYATNDTDTMAGPQLIDHLSSFYKARDNTSIVFTLGSYYFGDNASVAEARIAAVKEGLIAAGIAEKDVVVQAATQNYPEDEAEQATTATIAITSATNCKQ